MQTTTFNFADRAEVRAQVARDMVEYDPQLLEQKTDEAMREHDFEGYVV